MPIRFKYKAPNKKKTDKFLANARSRKYLNVLSKYGGKGVAALSSATPVDEGDTAGSWSFEVSIETTRAKIVWLNSNVTYQGTPIAIMLQYGHGTGTGGYVQGRDYINPAIRPIFDDIAQAAWEELINA